MTRIGSGPRETGPSGEDATPVMLACSGWMVHGRPSRPPWPGVWSLWCVPIPSTPGPVAATPDAGVGWTPHSGDAWVGCAFDRCGGGEPEEASRLDPTRCGAQFDNRLRGRRQALRRNCTGVGSGRQLVGDAINRQGREPSKGDGWGRRCSASRSGIGKPLCETIRGERPRTARMVPTPARRACNFWRAHRWNRNGDTSVRKPLPRKTLRWEPGVQYPRGRARMVGHSREPVSARVAAAQQPSSHTALHHHAPSGLPVTLPAPEEAAIQGG
jgi:hypothetical protein